MIAQQRFSRKTISSTEASNRFGTMLSEVEKGESLFVVTRMGKPKGVMIGIDQFREMIELLETAEEAGDEKFMAGLLEAYQDIQAGRTLTLKEFDAVFGFNE